MDGSGIGSGINKILYVAETIGCKRMDDGAGYYLSEPMGGAIRSILEETAEALESVNHYIWTLEQRIEQLTGVAREKVSEVV